MQTFRCECGARLFFVNSACLSCGRSVAFVPDRVEMVALPADGETVVAHGGVRYGVCANRRDFGVCNWLVEVDEGHVLCRACRLNDIIPDLGVGGHRGLWGDVEQAKRHLVYSLEQLGLPVQPRAETPDGLAFRFMMGAAGREVLTGHADGVITLNLEEADPVKREQARLSLREGYRTVLGHLRHEVGHYYWDRLVQGSDHLAGFRARFGDERRNYAEALDAHYKNPPPLGWHRTFISAYATSHPWEDWAETWAHLLHMVDTLETAAHFGLGPGASERGKLDVDTMVAAWTEVTVALNALNRSMGMPDAYPFAITEAIKEKLKFVALVVSRAAS